MEINKTVYGEIKTRKSLFPEVPVKRETETKETMNLSQENNREITDLISNEDSREANNIPSNKLNKLKDRQRIKDGNKNTDNQTQNEGILQKHPIIPIMQERPILKGFFF